MASIDTAIYTRLSGFAGLAALVSTRIYPAPVPDTPTYPLVTYQQISGGRQYAMGRQTPLVSGRIQVDCWSTTLLSARAVAEQVRQALSNYNGTSDTVVIDLATLDYEEALYDAEVDVQRVRQDYMITWRETALP